MSIINEALKKAEKENPPLYQNPSRATVKKLSENLQVEYQRKKSRVNWGPLFVLSVLILITTPIIAPVFSSPFKKGPALISSPPAPAPALPRGSSLQNRHSQFGIEEIARLPAAAMAPMRSPDFSVSGIVFSPKESYCIINRKVVKTGETVLGARLLNISPKEVTLEYQGQRLVLPVS